MFTRERPILLIDFSEEEMKAGEIILTSIFLRIKEG